MHITFQLFLAVGLTTIAAQVTEALNKKCPPVVAYLWGSIFVFTALLHFFQHFGVN